jgi:DNA-binding transcriptional regulator YdaS (Cro superfamily)
MSEQREVTKKAIKALGGQVAVADDLGVSQQAVSQWVSRKGVIPVEHILHVEKLLKDVGSDVDRYELRPDIYGDRPFSVSSESTTAA